MIGQLFLWLLPLRLRVVGLRLFYGFELAADVRLGFCIIGAKKVRLGAKAKIGHGTLIRGLDALELGESSSIGSFNWISGGMGRLAQEKLPNNLSTLRLGSHTSITNWHRFDCSAAITIGNFSTVAGWNTQFITHGINIEANQQEVAPITIGNYCLLGSRCTVLKGAALPDGCVLGAHSLLHKPMAEPYWLYAGVPAEAKKKLAREAKYFTRTLGRVL